jgi:uncharacterized ferredoxin-like protein
MFLIFCDQAVKEVKKAGVVAGKTGLMDGEVVIDIPVSAAGKSIFNLVGVLQKYDELLTI